MKCPTESDLPPDLLLHLICCHYCHPICRRRVFHCFCQIFHCCCQLRVGMAMGRVWAGFLYTRTRPADQDSQPEPGPIINRIFFFGAQIRPVGPRLKIIHPEIRTIPKSQITEYTCNFFGNHNIFLAIFLTNQSE